MDSMQRCILKSAIDADKIFVGSLSWQTSEESLRYHFEQYGPVMSVEGWVHLCGIDGYIKVVDLKSVILDANKIFVGGLLKNLCSLIITQTAPVALIQIFVARR
jgi:RNA recognition motif-containing protein